MKSRFANFWSQIQQIWVIFTYLWVEITHEVVGRSSETQLQVGENLNYSI